MPAHVSALGIGHLLHEYRIERLLGHGGFGLTYLAQDTNLNALVAIKEFLPQEFAVRSANSSVIPKSESDADSYRWGLERFKEEARALARFKHPNIVRAARLIEANGTAYMVMDFEPGMTLSQYLKRVSPTLDEAQVLGLFLPVLDGLEALHGMELVHRDIKPGNIYLRMRGGPMLIDFGAVRHAIGAHSRSLTAVVTPGYAPIEQYSSEGRQGPWSDLYAMGATMYCCMFGHPPMDAARRSAAISDGGDDPQPHTVSLGKGRYSQELLEALDWALSFRVRDRPQTAAAFRERLAAAPVKPQLMAVPKDMEDEPGMHHGVASDRSKQPVQVPPQELKSQPVEEEISAVMLKAHSGSPKPHDPDKTDIGAVAKAMDARSAPPAPKPEAVDFELPEESAAEAPPHDATEVIPKSPILERMGTGIRRAQSAKPAVKALDPEPVPATRSPKTGSPRTSRPVPLKMPAPPPKPPRRIPWLLIAGGVVLVGLLGGGIYAYLQQREAEETQYIWAAGVGTVAAYQQYLQTCHLCPHHSDAQKAVDKLENADKFARLKTEFELLLLRKALTPPAQPNASDDLRELESLQPGDPYLVQAHSELTAALPRVAPKPAAPHPAAPVNVPKPTAVAPATVQTKPVETQAPQTRPAEIAKPAPTPAAPKPETENVAAPKPQPVQSVARPAPVTQPAPQPQPAAPIPAPVVAVPVPSAPVEQQPRPISTPAPQYPRDALLSGLQGWVQVEFTVNTDGSVSDVTVLEAHPIIVFDKAAKRAVAGWRFTPYTVNGVPRSKRIQMRVDFKQ